MSTILSTICIYHGQCPDGFGAALVVRRWLQQQGRLDDAQFVPAQYGDTPPDVTGKDVFVVDFSFPRDVLLAMREAAKSLIVIDHHKSAQEALAGLDFCTFNMERAGCVLAWLHLFPGDNPPNLLLYLEDRDLWDWRLPESREISAAIRSYPFDFETWDFWLWNWFNVSNTLATEGAAILRYQEQCIASALSRPPAMIEIGGYTVPCVNSTHMISEIGNLLAKGHPFAALYFDTGDGKRVFSLRSDEDGVDVSEVARQYAGGGHRHAAGFTIPGPPVLHPISRFYETAYPV